MKKALGILVNIVRSYFVLVTLGTPGLIVVLAVSPLLVSVSLSGRHSLTFMSVGVLLESIALFTGLAAMSLLIGHVVASGWNKIVGCIVASAGYFCFCIVNLVSDDSLVPGSIILLLACMLLMYAVAGFLFVKYQKESKFGRVYFKWGALAVLIIFLVAKLPSVLFRS